MGAIRVSSLMIVFAAGLWCPAARAEDAAAAKRHNAAAKRHFNLGEFEKAIEAYKAAYEAKPVPDFLYNIGQCHRRLGGLDHLKQAVFSFESYLNNAPDSPNRDLVEAEIAEVKQKIAELERQQRPAPVATGTAEAPAATQPPPPGGTRPPHDATPVYRRWWFWSAAGTVAVLGTGLGLGVAARSDFKRAEELGAEGRDRAGWQDVKDAGQTKALVANVLFGVGGALAVTSVVLFFVERRKEAGERSGAAVLPTLGTAGAGLSLEGRF